MNGRAAALLSILLGMTGASSPAWAQTTGILPDAPPAPERIPEGALSLSLDEALSLAVAQNPDISGAELSRAMARVAESRARLNRFTVVADVDAGLGVAYVKPWKEEGYASQTASWGAGLSAAIPLYSGGRVEAQIRQAELDVAIADVDRQAALRALERAVVLNYWTIKGYELQLDASREALGINEEALAVIEARARAGLAAPIDVNRSRVNVLDQRDSILALEGQLYSAKQDLLQLLSQEGEEVVLTDPLATELMEWPEQPGELVDQARSRRPELRRFASEASRVDASIELARSAALPTLSFTAGLRVEGAAAGGSEVSSTLTDPITGLSYTSTYDPEFEAEDLGPDLTTSMGFNLSWTPFNLLQTRDAVSLARYSRRQVDARYESQLLQVEADVKAAHNALATLRERTAYIDERLSLARDNLQIIQALYAQGSAPILDLLQAQSAYQTANIQRASHQVNLIVAEYELRWAIGERFTDSQ